MKRTIKLAVVAALALGATSAFATNGSALIGMGAKTRGMGGVGIGVGHGAESALSNPALITTIKSDHEISFGGMVFMPDVEYTNYAGTSAESDADFFVVPSVSVANKVNDNFYWGVGMWGTGGLGVDYRDDATHMNMVTSLQNMQFGVPLVYTTNGFAIGVTPIVQYTALDINYVMPNLGGNSNAGDTIGAGVADDVSLGYNIGLAYETQGITLGAVYKSEVESDIKDVLSNALLGMGVVYDNNKISAPAEMGVGISYKMNEHTIALDYKMILWEDAETYKDFGWEDQDVIAIGYEYATEGWAVRAGYQYAESAVQDNAGKNLTLDTDMYPGGLTNMFNLLGFPGTEESHITLGGTYAFNETLTLDLAAVYALENKETFKDFMGNDIEAKHSETSYSVQLNYAF
ncbi:outer membrane protein transport protein [Sulfurimonas sp.]|uniref:OmpP1/FadL family transporter n=1 Tax=Sulfurimonas sp. TaxID=2022749 RepID=UPI001A0B0197|nr:outer membrane protein transport protein [Sulfurimonas sp.]MBE0513948.1 outer membrane protein transport protein [Sulfurimonas sp.]